MRRLPGALASALLACLVVGGGAASGQVGTASTYQGRLLTAGAPANGVYDLQLTLWDAASGGAQVGSTVVAKSVTVNGGLFTIAMDFGGGTFAGSRRWLEIGVRPAGSG